jgi:hypothetical protein
VVRFDVDDRFICQTLDLIGYNRLLELFRIGSTLWIFFDVLPVRVVDCVRFYVPLVFMYIFRFLIIYMSN